MLNLLPKGFIKIPNNLQGDSAKCAQINKLSENFESLLNLLSSQHITCFI